MSLSTTGIMKLVRRYATAERALERAEQRDAKPGSIRILEQDSEKRRDELESELDALIAKVRGGAQ